MLASRPMPCHAFPEIQPMTYSTWYHWIFSIVRAAMTYPRMLNMNLAAVVFYLSLFFRKEAFHSA